MTADTLAPHSLDLGSEQVHAAPRATFSQQPTAAQVEWSRRPIPSRLNILRRARHELATRATDLAHAISPHLARNYADTLVSEVLPLLDAVRFLEREAPTLLCSRNLGRKGLPFWLAGVHSEIHRVPYGRVLVIAPSNYPLLLPGVQVFQALAAGNAVVWKPGFGGAPVARLVAEVLAHAGLPDALLEVTEDTAEAAQDAIVGGVDKVFFTGSGATGRLLLRQLAGTATPCVVELSGNDAAVVLPSADLNRVVAALAFGMRLNGSATCMAPRRVLLVDCSPERQTAFVDRLRNALEPVRPVTLSAGARRQLVSLTAEAERSGATVLGDPTAEALKPILLLNGTPSMEIAQADIFAPVLTLISVRGSAGVLAAQAACPLALTTSIFGNQRKARALAREITCGTVTINDLIVPTADPRIPFGGRRQSGFGVTRGAEGLLEMTAVKVVSTRRSKSVRHYEPTREPHTELFGNIITAAHASGLAQRWGGIKRAFHAAMELNQK